jgi:hypothetical protein
MILRWLYSSRSLQKREIEFVRLAQTLFHKNGKYRSAEGENGFSAKRSVALWAQLECEATKKLILGPKSTTSTKH